MRRTEFLLATAVCLSCIAPAPFADSVAAAHTDRPSLAPADLDYQDLPMGGLFYGNHEIGLHTGNAIIAIDSARRFRASRSGRVVAVRHANRVLTDETIAVRCESNGDGSDWCDCIAHDLDERTCGYALGNSYSVGNGGRILVELRTDDDGWPGDTVLARTDGDFIPQEHPERYPTTLHFRRAAEVEAGRVYHLVYRNLAPPTRCGLAKVAMEDAASCERDAGAISLNGVYFGDSGIDRTIGVDPYRGRTAANLVRGSRDDKWRLDADNLSWYELGYDDGVWDGDSYAAHSVLWDASYVLDEFTRARQTFRIRDRDRRVDGVWINLGHAPGKARSAGRLEATLVDEAGDVLATAWVEGSPACRETARRGARSGSLWAPHCRFWRHADFDRDVRLETGQRYALEFASKDHGFLLASYFPLPNRETDNRKSWPESRAEISTDGGDSWQTWSDKYASDRDLPVLFTLVDGPRVMP